MGRYVLKRLAWTLVVLWGIVTITFAITFLSPVDPARSYAGLRAPNSVVVELRHKFGLDKPLWVQYVKYIERISRGDLGTSLFNDRPVVDNIRDRAPNTLYLALAAAFLQAIIGVPLGIWAAYRRGTGLDRGILTVSLSGLVTPSFVLGFLLLYVFAFRLSLFPLGGSGSPTSVVLPALTLAVAGTAFYARITRSAMLGVMNEGYATTARSKGLTGTTILTRHLLPNAASPIVTILALDIGVFLGGVLVIEKVFAWPGLGEMAWTAISVNDIPLVMGIVLFIAFCVTILNLIADIVVGLIDPRIRYK